MDTMKRNVLSQTSLSRLFPPDFLWGAATSAYQIEGAAREHGRGLSIWDQFAATPGATHRGETGDIAADHYHHMQEDVALMHTLGLGAYRFSIAWPRVLPEGTGTVNTQGLDFYDRLVDTLLAYGITPLVTLYHWDLPLALHERGGWLNRETAFAFAEYAEVVARRLGDRVQWWLTHNEPWCAAFLGYGIGVHAPGIRDMQSAYLAGHHLLLSHGLAMRRLRAWTPPTAQVGITLNLGPIYPEDDQPETLQAARRADAFVNGWFLDPIFRGCYPEALFADEVIPPLLREPHDLALIAAPVDFLGVNYYSRKVVRAPKDAAADSIPGGFEEVAQVPGASYTQMGAGWEVYPSGLTDLLVRVQHDYMPNAIMVTENGAAFEDAWDGNGTVSDPERLYYIREHIQALGRALAQGVPLRGYFLWSLLDNFEWSEGYSKRFGMVYVDYPTQRRIVKQSGRWYTHFLTSQHLRRK